MQKLSTRHVLDVHQVAIRHVVDVKVAAAVVEVDVVADAVALAAALVLLVMDVMAVAEIALQDAKGQLRQVDAIIVPVVVACVPIPAVRDVQHLVAVAVVAVLDAMVVHRVLLIVEAIVHHPVEDHVLAVVVVRAVVVAEDVTICVPVLVLASAQTAPDVPTAEAVMVRVA